MTTDLRSRLLAAQQCKGIPDASMTADDRAQIAACRGKRWLRKMNGPGAPYWELTRLGRIELEEQTVPVWVPREDF